MANLAAESCAACTVSSPKMVLPAMAVGVLCLVKSGAVMGTYSCKNYDENIKSAWEKENSLPGTDGIPREVISAPRLVFPSNDLSLIPRRSRKLDLTLSCSHLPLQIVFCADRAAHSADRMIACA